MATAGAGGTLALACYHCGQPVPRGVTRSVTVDGVPRPMCCAGCEAVASAILGGGLADYYRHREAMGNRPPDTQPGQGEPGQALAAYDDPEFQRGCVRTVGEGSQTTLLVEDMRCGACVWLIERTLAAQPGVIDVGANLSSGRLTVTWAPGRTRLSALVARLAAVGYRATPYDARSNEQRRVAGQRALMRRLFVAGLAMMQVMMYALPAYTATAGDLDPAFDSLMRWASLVLTVPVMAYSATPFFAGAWRDLRNRRAGMDVPVAIGLVAAFAASVAATVRGAGEVWFDTVTMFVFLLLTARWFEQRIHLRANRRIDALVASLPDWISRRRADGATERVSAGQARAGDRLLVGTGETFALDVRLTSGQAQVDQSMLTGESRPIDVAPGGEIAGGSLNLGAPVIAEVVRDSLHSAGSLIRQLTDRAAADKPRIAVAADRVAAVFVAALLLLAVGLFAVWRWIDPAMALPAAIAVLVVSCPCALSLATPAALAAAGSALLDRGLLVTRSSALEALAGVTDVVFDKTGTLTTGRPRLVAVQPLAAASAERGERDRRWLLQVAAALEAGSSHPHAHALRTAAAEAGAAAQDAVAAEPRVEAGRGVSGVVDGERFRLGSARFTGARHLRAVGVDDPDAAGAVDVDDHEGDSEVWLAREVSDPFSREPRPLPIARFVLRDTLHEGVRGLIDGLAARGVTVHLASGDREPAVDHCARRLGLPPARTHAQMLPDDKLKLVRRLQAGGARVLMVGDGINDAPVLAAADVSIAVNQASALARVSADLVSIRPGLVPVADALAAARRTARVIGQNLGWAMVYNGAAIPAAACGLVAPWVAALGMSLSSLVVALNAARLLRGR